MKKYYWTKNMTFRFAFVILRSLIFLNILNSVKANAQVSNSIKVLTVNLWLLEDPILGIDLTRKLKLRFNAQASLLKSYLENYVDIIFLQELWSPKKVEFLKNFF